MKTICRTTTLKLISALLIIFHSCFCKATTLSDTVLIKSYLTLLTKTENYRTYNNVKQLDITADIIKSVFYKYSDSVFVQEYIANGRTYRNVICSFGTENKKRIVIGAHYDVCGIQQGADDNASGIVGLLELSRLLKGLKLNYRIDLVAYSLEEPPYFDTEFMGSYIHAKSLHDSKADVLGMISLEMIGFFKDEDKSQSYPIGILSLIYGNKGNYITLVKKFHSGKFAHKFCKQFKTSKTIRTKIFTGPGGMQGIGFSDHLNYWKFGYSALMITDTAFYRNNNYHEPTDTMEKLDLARMAKVIDGVYITLMNL
ncbi:MAG: M28 family peptidase [Bacteroidia bacterium]|nr:M28 family peptidase [Bacteroidia bacterium]